MSAHRCPRIWRRRWRGPRRTATPGEKNGGGGARANAPPADDAGEPTTGGRGREVRFALCTSRRGGRGDDDPLDPFNDPAPKNLRRLEEIPLTPSIRGSRPSSGSQPEA